MRSLCTALAETRRPSQLFKDCQQTNYATRTQRFTQRYCWSTQPKSTQQGITWPRRMTRFIRRKKKCSTKRKQKSPEYPQLRRQQFHQFLPNRVQCQRLRHVESVNSETL